MRTKRTSLEHMWLKGEWTDTGTTRSSSANGTSVTDMSDPDPSEIPRVASPNLSTAAMSGAAGLRTG